MSQDPLRLVEDARGLAIEIDAPDSQAVRDLVIEPLQRGDISQISRHAAVMAARWKPRFLPRWRIQEMLDYAVAMGDFPRRNTSPARYLEAVDRWHARLAQLGELADAAEEIGQPLVDADGKPLAFPEPPCPGWHSGGDAVLPLRTPEEVLAEGNKMQNCVASRIPPSWITVERRYRSSRKVLFATLSTRTRFVAAMTRTSTRVWT